MQLAKGLCFRYNDKFGPGHRCNSSSLSLLEIMEDDSLEGRDVDGNVDGDATVVDRPKNQLPCNFGKFGWRYHETERRGLDSC